MPRKIKAPGSRAETKPKIDTQQFAPAVLPHYASKEVKFCALDEYPITPEKCCATCLDLSPVMQNHQLYSGNHAQKSGWQCTSHSSYFSGKIILNKDEAVCEHFRTWIP